MLNIINFFTSNKQLKINESRYIVLLVVWAYIKKLSSTDRVNIYVISIVFSIDFAWWKVEKSGITPHNLYRDSMDLIFKQFFGSCRGLQPLGCFFSFFLLQHIKNLAERLFRFPRLFWVSDEITYEHITF